MLANCFTVTAQTDPIAEIQGRLSIYDPIDTTSFAIGKNAGHADMALGRWNTIFCSLFLNLFFEIAKLL